MGLTDMTHDDRRGRLLGGWLLLALTLVLYLPGTATIPLMDRDEPRFAQATVEMMQRDNWAVPYFNGEYRFDKPPLTYWWMRLHYSLLGVIVLAARLHSVLAVFLTALVVAGMARRLTQSTSAGLFAGMAWLSSLQSLIHGRLCVADMPMILCVTLACRALVELLAVVEEPAKRWSGWFWCLWLSLGAGFLAKGPIAWLVPALACVLWRWVFWRKPLPWSRLQAIPGVLIVLAMAGAWGIPALIQTKGAFWQVGMGEHVVKRGTDVFNGRKFVPGFYLLTTWISLFPWLGFALPVWRSLRVNWTAQTTFLAAWFVAPQIIFFFYATQLPHYVMPGYPAFIVLLSLAWKNRQNDARTPVMARWLPVSLTLLVVTAGLLVFMMDVRHAAILALLSSALLILAVVLGLGGLASCVVWKNGFRGRSAWIACFVALLTGATLMPLGSQLQSSSVPERVAAHLKHLPSGVKLHGCGYSEPSLVFYTDRLWQFTDQVAAARPLIESAESVAVVVLKREWTLDQWFKGLLGTKPPGFPAKDYSAQVNELIQQSSDTRSHVIEGFNIARFSWVEVVVLIKR